MDALTATDVEREAYLRNVDNALERIATHRGVLGYFVMEPATGNLMKFAGFGGDGKTVRRYVERLRGLIDLGSSTIRSMDWEDDMTFCRLSYGAFDILIAPDLNKQYTLVVVQEMK